MTNPSIKRCVVAGAAKPGIGEAITRLLAGDGYEVHGTYEADQTKLAASMMRELPNLRMYEVDHALRSSLADFLRALPAAPCDALVYAMMHFDMEDPDAFDHDAWDRSLAVNLTAPNYLIHELKPRLRDGASIVTVTSTEAFIGSFGASSYGSTKAAIHNLMKTHANNLGHRGIRVNVVAPGWIGGVMDTDEVFNLSRRITPLGRLGEPAEVAQVIRFLLSPQSSFVNGTVITVDGGYTGVDTIAQYEFQEFTKAKRPNKAA